MHALLEQSLIPPIKQDAFRLWILILEGAEGAQVRRPHLPIILHLDSDEQVRTVDHEVHLCTRTGPPEEQLMPRMTIVEPGSQVLFHQALQSRSLNVLGRI